MSRSGGKRSILLEWPNLFLKFADVTGHQFNASTRGLIAILFMLFILVILAKIFVNGKDIR